MSITSIVWLYEVGTNTAMIGKYSGWHILTIILEPVASCFEFYGLDHSLKLLTSITCLISVISAKPGSVLNNLILLFYCSKSLWYGSCHELQSLWERIKFRILYLSLLYKIALYINSEYKISLQVKYLGVRYTRTEFKACDKIVWTLLTIHCRHDYLLGLGVLGIRPIIHSKILTNLLVIIFTSILAHDVK